MYRKSPVVTVFAAWAVAIALSAAASELNSIRGTDKADQLGGTPNPDLIEGLGGNDTLVGGPGNDVLVGGPGRDVLQGGTGSDVHLFGIGAGGDQINDYDASKGRRDVVRFNKSVNWRSVKLRRAPKYGLIVDYGRGDRIQIPRHFEDKTQSGFQIDAIEFADGTIWDIDAIQAIVLRTEPWGQYMVGLDTNETLDGGGGDDAIYGEHGDDVLIGGEGGDQLYGGPGKDVLIGGHGNDVMRGELGSDTYIYRNGDGRDAIKNFSRPGDIDILKFPDHSLHMVEVTTRGTDLILTIAGQKDALVRIQGYNASMTWPLHEIHFKDGRKLTHAQLQKYFPVIPKRSTTVKEPRQPTLRVPAARKGAPPAEVKPEPPKARPVRIKGG